MKPCDPYGTYMEKPKRWQQRELGSTTQLNLYEIACLFHLPVTSTNNSLIEIEVLIVYSIRKVAYLALALSTAMRMIGMRWNTVARVDAGTLATVSTAAATKTKLNRA